jgi:small-conductance mechanosensitive channel
VRWHSWNSDQEWRILFDAPSAIPMDMEWNEIVELVQRPLFTLGQKPVSAATLALLLGVVIGAMLLSRVARTILRTRILSRTVMDVGLQYALARIAGYVVLVLGLLVGLSAVGIDLSSLTVLIGALGVGIGFGLQNIINNFVSGLVILFERPIQIGHRVEVGDIAGRVERIGARGTTIVTNDNIALIIPNSEFISSRVVNWSLGGDRRVRFHIPIGVSYGSDPKVVRQLLEDVALANPDVLKDPRPDLMFDKFGDSSIDFELRVWTETMSDRPKVLASALYYAIWEVLHDNDIEIPFPQRDLNFKGPVHVQVTRGGEADTRKPEE